MDVTVPTFHHILTARLAADSEREPLRDALLSASQEEEKEARSKRSCDQRSPKASPSGPRARRPWRQEHDFSRVPLCKLLFCFCPQSGSTTSLCEPAPSDVPGDSPGSRGRRNSADAVCGRHDLASRPERHAVVRRHSHDEEVSHDEYADSNQESSVDADRHLVDDKAVNNKGRGSSDAEDKHRQQKQQQQQQRHPGYLDPRGQSYHPTVRTFFSDKAMDPPGARRKKARSEQSSDHGQQQAPHFGQRQDILSQYPKPKTPPSKCLRQASQWSLLGLRSPCSLSSYMRNVALSECSPSSLSAFSLGEGASLSPSPQNQSLCPLLRDVSPQLLRRLGQTASSYSSVPAEQPKPKFTIETPTDFGHQRPHEQQSRQGHNIDRRPSTPYYRRIADPNDVRLFRFEETQLQDRRPSSSQASASMSTETDHQRLADLWSQNYKQFRDGSRRLKFRSKSADILVSHCWLKHAKAATTAAVRKSRAGSEGVKYVPSDEAFKGQTSYEQWRRTLVQKIFSSYQAGDLSDVARYTDPPSQDRLLQLLEQHFNVKDVPSSIAVALERMEQEYLAGHELSDDRWTLAQRLAAWCLPRVEQRSLSWATRVVRGSGRDTQCRLVQMGAGSFGKVVGGRLESGEKVAVKHFHSQAHIDRKDIVFEALMMAHLQDSAAVPEFYGLLCSPELGWSLVQENVADGCTLCRALPEIQALSRQSRLFIAFQLVRGLREIHCRGVAINDIKSNNILIDLSSRPERAVFIDFGIATYRSDTLPDYQSILHRPGARLATGHVAPEVLRGRDSATSVGADKYSLGRVLAELNVCSQDLSLAVIAQALTAADPARRPSLEDVLRFLDPLGEMDKLFRRLHPEAHTK